MDRRTFGKWFAGMTAAASAGFKLLAEAEAAPAPALPVELPPAAAPAGRAYMSLFSSGPAPHQGAGAFFSIGGQGERIEGLGRALIEYPDLYVSRGRAGGVTEFGPATAEIELGEKVWAVVEDAEGRALMFIPVSLRAHLLRPGDSLRLEWNVDLGLDW